MCVVCGVRLSGAVVVRDMKVRRGAGVVARPLAIE